MSSDAGRLVLVATPIGNLGDLSPRAAEALRSADAIACEDTRHTRKLLSASGITRKRLLAVHEHNEAAAADGLIALMLRGETVALVTDAGMPAISDPGSRVVAAVVDAGLDVTCVPGPSAFLVALALSGLPTDRFVFEGFLPRSGRERTRRLRTVAEEERTVVLYESPHRIVRTLSDLVEAAGGERRCSVSRELTKHFEHTWRGTLAGAVASVGGSEPRGEYAIVVDGATADASTASDESVESLVADARSRGLSTREAADAVSRATGRARRDVYAIAVEISRRSPSLPDTP